MEVDSVMQEIKEANKTGDFNTRMEGNRRAVVFYVDKGERNLGYIPWWTFTWKQIGLDSEKEAFDIILMTHPSQSDQMWRFSPNFGHFWEKMAIFFG